MPDLARQAAYICGARDSDMRSLAPYDQAVAAYASERGWPAPAVYADAVSDVAAGRGPAMARLTGAIGAGRHDAVVITGPGLMSPGPIYLMDFLFRCTRHGVTVAFLSPPPAARDTAIAPRPGPRPRTGTGAAPLLAARHRPPVPLPGQVRDVLVSAALEALAGLFPDWLVWSDDHGWHGRRRASMYRQGYGRGAPAFCVHAASSLDLAAQLRWQQAADIHAPLGCSAG